MKNIIPFIIMLLIFSCSVRNPSAEAQDSQLNIQAMRSNTPKDSLCEYKVRIFTKNPPQDKGLSKLNEQMQIGADSLFYRIRLGVREYPEVSIPIAASLANCYEYVLLFGPEASTQDTSSKLIYQDKYINGKSYTLSLR